MDLAADSNVTTELDIGGRYKVIALESSYPSGPRRIIGRKNTCRYCGEKNPALFRSVAHLFPEFLGNKNITSADECDDCNQAFKQFDSELAHYLQPLLTLGNVRGKKGSPITKAKGVRLERKNEAGDMAIQTVADSIGSNVKLNPITKTISLQIPIPDVRFRPQRAYKALVKMGLALLPEDEIKNFQKLLLWIAGNDSGEPTSFDVVFSFCNNILNPLKVVQGALIRRVDSKDNLPYMIFLLSAGAVCAQICLHSDLLDEHVTDLRMRKVNIKWRIGFGKPGQSIDFKFINPQVEDWRSTEVLYKSRNPIEMTIGYE